MLRSVCACGGGACCRMRVYVYDCSNTIASRGYIAREGGPEGKESV